MLKKLFVTAVLLLAVLSFVVSLLKGNNNKDISLNVPECVAVVDIVGPIVSGSTEVGLLNKVNGVGSRDVMAQIRDAAEDISVRALLLNIDSPGGSPTAAEEIGKELERFKAVSKKPIVATMGDTGASAAYWIAACASDKIYANATTLTGSIGVYVPYLNVQKLMDTLGVTSNMIKSGEHKGMLSPDRELTQEEKDIMQNLVNEIHEQFIDVVAKGRHMDGQQLRSLADGRVYTGKQAKNVGLIDEVGNYYDALAEAAKLGGIDGAPVIKKRPKESPWEAILGAEIVNNLKAQLLQGLQGNFAEVSPR